MKALLRSCLITLLMLGMYAGVMASSSVKAFPGGSIPTCIPGAGGSCSAR